MAGDLTGRKFGSWTVITYGKLTPYGKRSWVCECECGVRKEVDGRNLERKKSTRCRSCAAKLNSARTQTHGKSESIVYRRWLTIKTRCYNQRSAMWKTCGAYGFKMDSEWQFDFPAFYACVGDPPSDHHVIDLIDPLKDFVPGNVRWATQGEQRDTAKKMRERVPDV